MAKINTENEQYKQEQNDVFDSSKTAFKTLVEENISKAMVSESNTETVEQEDLESILNSPNLLTKGKKINLSYLDKETREVFKEAIEAEYRKLIEVFEALLEMPNVSQDELISKIQTECECIVARHPSMSIKFTHDGSIDLRTVLKRFRLKYRELEERRRAKYKRKIQGILSDNHRISLAQVSEIRDEGKAQKKPFKGKFKQ